MKLIHYIAIGMVCALASIVIVFSYWSLEGIFFHKVFNAEEIHIQTLKDTYKQDEDVQGRFSLCQYRDVPITVQWSLIDTYLRTYPARGIRSPIKGCITNGVGLIETISPTLPADTYYFSGTLTLKINPIKNITIPMRTNSFRVEEK